MLRLQLLYWLAQLLGSIFRLFLGVMLWMLQDPRKERTASSELSGLREALSVWKPLDQTTLLDNNKSKKTVSPTAKDSKR